MKIQFHPDFGGDDWTGAIGAQALSYDRASLPVEPESDALLAYLLSGPTWQRREEYAGAAGETRVRFVHLPVFVPADAAPVELPAVRGPRAPRERQ